MDDNHLVRHLLSTLAYRARKVIEDAPAAYPEFSAGSGVCTPVELLHHISGVLSMADSALLATDRADFPLEDWRSEVKRFYDMLERIDHAIADGAQPQKLTWEQLVQGPLSDALTHIGQLATLRRLAGNPVARVSYTRADIQVGQIRLH